MAAFTEGAPQADDITLLVIEFAASAAVTRTLIRPKPGALHHFRG